MPAVSVSMPTWNRGRYRVPAGGSILEQFFGGLEVFIVDDGSTDGDIVRVPSVHLDLRIRLVRNKKRNGINTPRWTAAKMMALR